MQIELNEIQNMIYMIRGQKVMLDSDLAKLYAVETKSLNRQVRRNLNRFPEDFMFQLTSDEYENLRCQNGTSSLDYGGRRYQPLVFTENGVAMLSSVLRSDTAISINIAIMRVFTKLRSFHALESRVEKSEGKVSVFESEVTQIFKVVLQRLDNLEEVVINEKNRKQIGLK